MAYVVRVDEITKVSEKAVCCQFADLEKPTILPFSLGNELIDKSRREVSMSSGMAKSTAKALGLSLDEFVAHYGV